MDHLHHITEISTAAKALVTSFFEDPTASSHDAPIGMASVTNPATGEIQENIPVFSHSSFVAAPYGAVTGSHLHWHTHDGMYHHHSTNFYTEAIEYLKPQLIYQDPVFKEISFPLTWNTQDPTEWGKASDQWTKWKMANDMGDKEKLLYEMEQKMEHRCNPMTGCEEPFSHYMKPTSTIASPNQSLLWKAHPSVRFSTVFDPAKPYKDFVGSQDTKDNFVNMRIMNIRNGDVVYDANFKIEHSLTHSMCASFPLTAKTQCAHISEHEDPTGGEEGRVWGGSKEINGKTYYPGSGKQLVE